jgi:hypothetical protein
MKTYTEAAARLGIAAVSRKIFDLTNLVFWKRQVKQHQDCVHVRVLKSEI